LVCLYDGHASGTNGWSRFVVSLTCLPPAAGGKRQTVASAMIVLRSQGLIVGQQGRAVYVTADPRAIRALAGGAALVDDTAPPAARS